MNNLGKENKKPDQFIPWNPRKELDYFSYEILNNNGNEPERVKLFKHRHALAMVFGQIERML